MKRSMCMWYWITLHSGLRGREVQLQLRKTDLVFNERKDGVFIMLATNCSSKTCQGGASGREFNTVGRIDNLQFTCCWKNCLLPPPACPNWTGSSQRQDMVHTSSSWAQSSWQNDGTHFEPHGLVDKVHKPQRLRHVRQRAKAAVSFKDLQKTKRLRTNCFCCRSLRVWETLVSHLS